MLRTSIIVVAAVFAFIPTTARSADDPRTLLTRIAEYQYPGSKMSGASMSDAATVNEKGDRTVQSIHCKTVLTTTDPIDKVFEYYRLKLAQNEHPQENETAVAAIRMTGRSVTFHSDAEGRPVVLHIISINSARTSTTLVISRAVGESETHIAWSQYEQFEPNPTNTEAD